MLLMPILTERQTFSAKVSRTLTLKNCVKGFWQAL